MYKLAYLVSHPIQYQAPLLRYLAARPEIDLTVFFLSDVSTRLHVDRGFRKAFHWDVPLLGGYRHVFLEPWYRTKRRNFFEPAVRDLAGQLERGGFDALWVHGWFHQANLRALQSARSLGMRVLLRGESTLLRDVRWSRVRSALQRRVLALADGYLAIGTRNREFYLHHGVAPELVFDVPYAVDNEFFESRARRASERREELRAALDLEPGRPVILYAAKLAEHKRPLDLLAAYELLSPGTHGQGAREREPEPYLLFVGDGPERRRVELCAAATGWRSIRFLGFKNQTELPGLYDLCDVFALPSEFEPWGLVVNEVMNAARPVVACERVGAAADLVRDGVNGFTFPARDVRALSERLAHVLGDAQRRAALGRASLDLVSGWNFERDCEGLLSALGSPSARRRAA